MRTVLAAVAAAFALAAIVAAALLCFTAAVWLAFWGLLLLIGLLIERWRYKPLAGRSPGPDWQMTGERFVDPETGKLVTVYFHPATGERRYVSA